MEKDSKSERLRQQGDAIIDRTAKKMLTDGYVNVTTSVAGFYYIFGERKYKELVQTSFDYVYTRNRVLGEAYTNFDMCTAQIIDSLCYTILHVYNGLDEEQRAAIELRFANESELEKMIKEHKPCQRIVSVSLKKEST